MRDDTWESRIWEALTSLSMRYLAIALAIGLLFAAVAAGAMLSASPSYYSEALLVIDNPLEIATSPSADALEKLNALRRKYAALVPTTVIAGPVAERLGLPFAELSESLSVTVSRDSLLMTIAATGLDPELTEAVADATSQQLVEYVAAEHEANAVPEPLRFDFTVIDEAEHGTKIAPTRRRAVGVAAVAGGVGMVCAYVALQLVAPRGRTRA